MEQPFVMPQDQSPTALAEGFPSEGQATDEIQAIYSSPKHAPKQVQQQLPSTAISIEDLFRGAQNARESPLATSTLTDPGTGSHIPSSLTPDSGQRTPKEDGTPHVGGRPDDRDGNTRDVDRKTVPSQGKFTYQNPFDDDLFADDPPKVTSSKKPAASLPQATPTKFSLPSLSTSRPGSASHIGAARNFQSPFSPNPMTELFGQQKANDLFGRAQASKKDSATRMGSEELLELIRKAERESPPSRESPPRDTKDSPRPRQSEDLPIPLGSPETVDSAGGVDLEAFLSPGKYPSQSPLTTSNSAGDEGNAGEVDKEKIQEVSDPVFTHPQHQQTPPVNCDRQTGSSGSRGFSTTKAGDSPPGDRANQLEEAAKLSLNYLSGVPGQLWSEAKATFRGNRESVIPRTTYHEIDIRNLGEVAIFLNTSPEVIAHTVFDYPFWIKSKDLRRKPLERLLTLEEQETYWGSWNMHGVTSNRDYISYPLRQGRLRLIQQLKAEKALLKPHKGSKSFLSDVGISQVSQIAATMQQESRLWIMESDAKEGDLSGTAARVLGGFDWSELSLVPRHVDWNPTMGHIVCVSLTHSDPNGHEGNLIGGFAVIDCSKLNARQPEDSDVEGRGNLLHSVQALSTTNVNGAVTMSCDHEALVCCVFGHTKVVNSLRFTPHMSTLITCADDGRVCFWLVGDRGCLKTMDLDPGQESKWIPKESRANAAFYVHHEACEDSGSQRMYFAVLSAFQNRTLLQLWLVLIRNWKPDETSKKLVQVISFKAPPPGIPLSPPQVEFNCVEFAAQKKMVILSSWSRMSLICIQFDGGRFRRVLEAPMTEPVLSLCLVDPGELSPFGVYTRSHRTIALHQFHLDAALSETPGSSATKAHGSAVRKGQNSGSLQDLMQTIGICGDRNSAAVPEMQGAHSPCGIPSPTKGRVTLAKTDEIQNSLPGTDNPDDTRLPSPLKTSNATVAIGKVPNTQPPSGSALVPTPTGSLQKGPLIDMDATDIVTAPETGKELLDTVLSGGRSGDEVDGIEEATRSLEADVKAEQSLEMVPDSMPQYQTLDESLKRSTSLQDPDSSDSNSPLPSPEPLKTIKTIHAEPEAVSESQGSNLNMTKVPHQSESDLSESQMTPKRRRRKKKDREVDSVLDSRGELNSRLTIKTWSANQSEPRKGATGSSFGSTASAINSQKVGQKANLGGRKGIIAETKGRRPVGTMGRAAVHTGGQAAGQSSACSSTVNVVEPATTCASGPGSSPPTGYAPSSAQEPQGISIAQLQAFAAAMAATTSSKVTADLSRNMATVVDDRLALTLPTYFEALYAKLEKDRTERQSLESAKHEQLLRVISQTLKENVTRVLEELVRTQLQQTVLPRVVEVCSQVTFNTLRDILQNNDLIKAVVAGNVQQVLIPAYQSLTKAMFDQVQDTFGEGIKQVLQVTEKNVLVHMVPRLESVLNGMKDQLRAHQAMQERWYLDHQQQQQLQQGQGQQQQVPYQPVQNMQTSDLIAKLQEGHKRKNGLLGRGPGSQFSPQGINPQNILGQVAAPGSKLQQQLHQWQGQLHSHQQASGAQAKNRSVVASPVSSQLSLAGTTAPLGGAASVGLSSSLTGGNAMNNQDLVRALQRQYEAGTARSRGGVEALLRSEQQPFGLQTPGTAALGYTGSIDQVQQFPQRAAVDYKRKELLQRAVEGAVTEAVEDSLDTGDDEHLLTLVTNLPADQVFQRHKFPPHILIRMIPQLVPYVQQQRSIADWVQECILALQDHTLSYEMLRTYKQVLENSLKEVERDRSPRGVFLTQLIQNAIDSSGKYALAAGS